MNLLILDSQVSHLDLPARDPRARHLRQVLRVQDGQSLRIGVRNGPLGQAVVSLQSDGYRLSCSWGDASLPLIPLTLILGHPRPPVLRRLVRDLTAMRVARLFVCASRLSEQSYLQSSVWDQIETAVDEGLSQGMHTGVPEIRRVRRLDDALALLDGAQAAGGPPDQRWLAAPGGARVGLAAMLSGLDAAGLTAGVSVAVGPERGFTAEEEDHLSGAGFLRLSLGASILRTETAAITLCGACCATLSDLSAGDT